MSNNILSLITYRKENSIVVGSRNDSRVDYKNDTDIFETITAHESKEELVKEFYKVITHIINNIKKNQNIIFSEFKAGIYEPLYISDEDILSKSKRTKFYKLKYKEKLINKELLDIILNLHHSDFLYFCSNLYKVRWTIEDINKKETKLFNGEIYKFDNIFDKQSIVKIDIFYFDGNTFAPYSNMFEIINNGNHITSFGDSIQSMNDEIKGLLQENNPYKAVKRAYSIAKMNKDHNLEEQLLIIINSPAGALYQLKGLVNNCEEVLYLSKKPKTLQQVRHSLFYLMENYDINTNLKKLFMKAQTKKTAKPLIKILIKIQEILHSQVARLTNRLLTKYTIKI